LGGSDYSLGGDANDGFLTPSTQGVAHDSPTFLFKGLQFPVNVFSLANQAPWTANFICLRYELENATGNTVPLVFWNLIDEWRTNDLPGHGRLARVRRRPSASKNAVQAPTKLKAFRSEEVSTMAWQRIEDWSPAQQKAEMPETMQHLRFERSAALDPVAKTAIEAGQIPDVEVAVVNHRADFTSLPPPVGDTLRIPLGEVQTVSRVVRLPPKDGSAEQLLVDTSIVIRPSPGVKVEGFAPALVAMRTTATDDYLLALEKSREGLGGLPATGGEVSLSALTRDDANEVYIIEHPVSVHWFSSDQRSATCIIIASYSPFPISVGQDYCIR
jgi:hypothetical protein